MMDLSSPSVERPHEKTPKHKRCFASHNGSSFAILIEDDTMITSDAKGTPKTESKLKIKDLANVKAAMAGNLAKCSRRNDLVIRPTLDGVSTKEKADECPANRAL